MASKRVELPRRTINFQVTIGIPFVDEDGEPLNLDGKDIEAGARKPDGTKILNAALAFTKRTQTGRNIGLADLLLTAAQHNATGEWWLDVYTGSTGKVERPNKGRYKWTTEAADTK